MQTGTEVSVQRDHLEQKTFSLTGSIENTGLIEVPMGTTLREIILISAEDWKSGAAFKAVQIGGPSGGCLTEEHLDVPS